MRISRTPGHAGPTASTRGSLPTDGCGRGGNPFADAKWDEAWKTSVVDTLACEEFRNGLRDEANSWREALGFERELNKLELTGMISSVAHLAYHFGAIRQIARGARGPREGVFQQP